MSHEEQEQTEWLRRALCSMLGEFRRACYRDMAVEERAYFVQVLNTLEGGLEGHADGETLRALVRFRRALVGAGLSVEERAELAMPDGFLDQVEACVLQVTA